MRFMGRSSNDPKPRRNRVHGRSFLTRFKDMDPPAKQLMKLVPEKQIAHGGIVLFRRMIDKVYVGDPWENIKMGKEKPAERIDGAVALVMVLDRAI